MRLLHIGEIENVYNFKNIFMVYDNYRDFDNTIYADRFNYDYNTELIKGALC